MLSLRIVRSAIMCAAVLPIGVILAAPCGAWARFPEASPVEGEFDNDDPVALARGALVATDCDHHVSIGEKTYCFESDASLLAFQKDPGLLAKAQAFWLQRHAP